MQGIRTLQSKLTPPHAEEALDRPRLHLMLESVAEKRLTLVVGGAGFGKTTLVARHLRRSGLRTVWYTLGKSDVDFVTFMSYLIQGFRSLGKEGEDPFADIRFSAPGAGASPENILTHFLSDIEENIRGHVVLVLDDFYLASDGPEIRDAVQFMLDHLPEKVHMIIISRREPDVRVSRLRVMREIMDIGEKDLAFTIPEIEELYSRLFDISISGENAETLHRKTSGWAASLVLFNAILKGKGNKEIKTSLDRLAGSQKYIFQYLEENIFELQSPEMKRFMLKTSLLSRMDTAFCDAFLGIDDSAGLLGRLAGGHLLTFPVDEKKNVYYYHHLLRDFLRVKQERLLGGRKVEALHRAIAGLLEENGEEYEALTHYLDGKCFTEASRLIRDLELRLLIEGRLRFIRDCLRKFPEGFAGSAPWLQYIEAMVFSFSGKPHDAIRELKAESANFQRLGRREDVTKCQADLGRHYYYTGDIRRAESRLKSLLAESNAPPVVHIEINGLLILFSAILGKMDEADEYAGAARQALDGLSGSERIVGDAWVDLSVSYRFYVSGDFAKSHELNLDIMEKLERENAEIVLPLGFFQSSATCYYLGRSRRGWELARAGVRIAKKNGVHDSMLGWLYYAWGLNAMGLGKIEEATSHAEKSLEIFTTQHNSWGRANAYDLLHLAHLESGHGIEEAEKNILAGLAVVEGLDLPVTEGVLELGLAGILVEKNTRRDDRLMSLIEKARTKLAVSKFYMFRIHLLLARRHLRRGREAEALEEFTTALGITEANDYGHFVEREKRWAAPLMDEPLSRGMKNDLSRGIPGSADKGKSSRGEAAPSKGRVDESASDAAPGIPAGRAAPPGLRIRLLGKFRVWRGGEEIPGEMWKNSKATMIFKYLAAGRKKGFVHRDVLIELLWPEDDIGKTGKRFNVAISSLRRILEPGLVRGRPSSYIIRRGDSFRLRVGEGGGVDVEAFARESEAGRGEEESAPGTSIRRFLNAVSLYRGDFLVEDPYIEWCVEQREGLKETYLNALWKLLSFFEERKEYVKCIEYATMYLAADRCAEHVYGKLMRFYAETGDISRVKQTFERCGMNIETHLECPLSRETIDLYHELMRGNREVN